MHKRHPTMFNINELYFHVPNTDEMVARIGSWQDNNLQIKAGREAVKMIDYYIKNDISFHQETTLSGKSIIKNIKKAKENGYKFKVKKADLFIVMMDGTAFFRS